MPSRLILFGIPLTAVVAGHIKGTYGVDNWNIAFAAASISTLFLFQHCFKFVHEFIPEAGDLITDMVELLKRILKLR